MEVQDNRDSRREIQTLQEAVAQQNQVLQRLERSLKRLEESYDRMSSRVDAMEIARPGNGPAETTPAVEKGRSGAPASLTRSGGQSKDLTRERVSRTHGNPVAAQVPGVDAPPVEHDGPTHDESGQSHASQGPGTSASRPNLLSRAKLALRGAIADGTVNNTLDKIQSSLKLADEAAGALSQISAMVKASLEQSAGVQGSGAPPSHGVSFPLLLDLAKTPQFQRFVASMLTHFLEDVDPDQAPASS
ncbi:MAG: SlyX family protein [Firmicutes bacterium]|nr:SlyX family protein [Bacillota bacterium]